VADMGKAISSDFLLEIAFAFTFGLLYDWLPSVTRQCEWAFQGALLFWASGPRAIFDDSQTLSPLLCSLVGKRGWTDHCLGRSTSGI
jgi:hypothetical protein